MVRTPGLLANLLFQLEKGDWAVQKEAIWALSNTLTSGGEEVLHFVVANGAIKPLVKMLRVDEPKIIQVAMEAVGAILEAGNPPPGTGAYSCRSSWAVSTRGDYACTPASPLTLRQLSLTLCRV